MNLHSMNLHSLQQGHGYHSLMRETGTEVTEQVETEA